MDELKTSEEWSTDPEFKDVTVYDPDGWDRTNYQYSWYEEKISRQEYRKRQMYSTCMWKNKND